MADLVLGLRTVVSDAEAKCFYPSSAIKDAKFWPRLILRGHAQITARISPRVTRQLAEQLTRIADQLDAAEEVEHEHLR